MSTNYSNLWGKGRYDELAKLPLPKPALIIDVRRGGDTDYGSTLIWNVAIQLEDLAIEMKLNQVPAWKFLDGCIEFCKISPFTRGGLQPQMSFRLTNRLGETFHLVGPDGLAEYVEKTYLDTVRTNRNAAIKDKIGGTESQDEPIHVVQSTVDVFFIADADDQMSLLSASFYAELFKRWNHEYDEATRPNRERRLTTILLCMNIDSRRHHPEDLAENIGGTHEKNKAFDKALFLQNYRDDDTNIEGNILANQVELLLHILLLLPPHAAVLKDVEINYESHHVASLNGAHRELPAATYLIGMASLEYSARWATRWVDCCLVCTLIKIICRTKPKEEVLGEREAIREKVQLWLDNWLGSVKPASLPEFQILDQLRKIVSSWSLANKSAKSSVEDLISFLQQIKKYYASLPSIAANISKIRREMKKTPIQSDSQNGEQKQAINPYGELLEAQTKARLFQVELFEEAEGALPRAITQVSELTTRLEPLRLQTKKPVDLAVFQQQIEEEIESAQEQLKFLQRKRGFFRGKRELQQEYQRISQAVAQKVQAHLTEIESTITAHLALAMLQEADLYEPSGGPSRYRERLKAFDEMLRGAHDRAAEQSKNAARQLQLSLSPVEIGAASELSSSQRLSLQNRKDLLNWDQVTDAYIDISKTLRKNQDISDLMNLFAEMLLRRLGTEKPIDLANRHRPWYKAIGPSASEEQEDQRLLAIGTALITILLSLKIVNTDLSEVSPLLVQYADLKQHSQSEPSVLELNISELERMVKDALKDQAMRDTLIDQPDLTEGFTRRYVQPIEMILAAWVENLHSLHPTLTGALDRKGILARLAEAKKQPGQVLHDLRDCSCLMGYRDEMFGEDYYYLLIPPGEECKAFLQASELQIRQNLQPVFFPDTEKLIYLQTHRIQRLVVSNKVYEAKAEQKLLQKPLKDVD